MSEESEEGKRIQYIWGIEEGGDVNSEIGTVDIARMTSKVPGSKSDLN